MITRENPKRGEIYRHCYGAYFRIIDVIQDNDREIVIYADINNDDYVNARTLSGFMRKVSTQSNGSPVPTFTRCEEMEK